MYERYIENIRLQELAEAKANDSRLNAGDEQTRLNLIVAGLEFDG